MISFIQANSQHIPLPNESVQCVVTSPPYYGLRKYDAPDTTYGEWDGQLGLEPSPEMYLEHLVSIFREVWRVLRKDGTLWLNMGDSYASSKAKQVAQTKDLSRVKRANNNFYRRPGMGNYKPKDLMMMPHRLALALQSDGWWVRSKIIWEKPNCMPSSVKDRPTTSHEYVFLLAKSARYYYDHEAIKEPLACPNAADGTRVFGGRHKHGANAKQQRTTGRVYDAKPSGGRNKRTVWTVNTKPYKGAHYATFPDDLVEPMILAGSSNGDIVLDPLGGTGVAAIVADRLGRHGIVIDISNNYLHLAQERYQKDLEKR